MFEKSSGVFRASCYFVQLYRTMEGSAKKTLFESQALGSSDEPEEDGWSEIPDEQDPDEDGEGPEDLHDEIMDFHRGKPTWSAKRARVTPKKSPFPAGGGDLAEYFGDIEPSQQIAICRAYASYLAAQSRARKPGYPAKYMARSK